MREPDSYVTWIDCAVSANDGKQEVQAGRVFLYRINVEEARNDGQDMIFVLDAHSSEILEYAPLFDEEECELHDGFSKDGSGFFGRDLLIIERMEILPTFRKKNLGLALAHRIIHDLGGGCGAVALTPKPVRYRPENEKEWMRQMQVTAFNENRSVGQKKLQKYWGKLGFYHAVNDVFIFDLAYRLPEISIQ